MISLLTICSVLAIMGGLVTLIRGLRGDFIGKHPYCRRCGFDLRGMPPDSVQCAECGTSVNVPGTVRIGQRVRRRGMIAVGISTLVPALLCLGAVGLVRVSAFDATPYKPAWWLRHDALSANTNVSKTATQELIRRVELGLLSDGQINAMADAILVRQANPSQAWQVPWGDFIEAARTGGVLSDERWSGYAANAPNVSLRVRPRVRLGDPIPYWIDWLPARVGSGRSLYASYRDRVIRIGPSEHRNSGGQSGVLSPDGSGSSGTEINPDNYRASKPGETQLRLTDHLMVGKSAEETHPVAQRLIELAAPFTFIPPDQATVTVRHDPSMHGRVAKALSVHAIRGSDHKLSVDVQVNGTPVGIAFDVFARQKSREIRVGRFACPAGTTSHGWGMDVAGKGVTLDGDRLDIVLRSNPESAIHTTDTFEVWDGEIILKDVPVKRQ